MTEQQLDARDLLILRLHDTGVPAARIAGHPKVRLVPSTVSKRIRLIRAEDCAHDPEAHQYWSSLT